MEDHIESIKKKLLDMVNKYYLVALLYTNNLFEKENKTVSFKMIPKNLRNI